MGANATKACCSLSPIVKPRKLAQVYDEQTIFRREEVNALRHGWERAIKKRNVGIEIIATLLNDKAVFRFHIGVNWPQSETVDVSAIQRHFPLAEIVADGVEAFLDRLVAFLNEGITEDDLVAMCRAAGVTHYHRGVCFGAENWMSVKRATLQMIVPDDDDAPGMVAARAAWNNLMTFIVREMKRGYLHEAMQSCNGSMRDLTVTDSNSIDSSSAP